MFRRRFSILIVLLTLALAASAQEIPAGTRLSVRTGSTLSSEKASVGESWQGTLVRDVVVNGKTIAKSGSTVHGKVTYVKNSGRLHAPGQITVRLTSIETKDGSIAIQSSAVSRKGESHTKSNATKIGGGAAAGALIGGLVGGGKGALIGGGAGAGAGTGVAAATGKKEAVIPAESTLSFTTTASSRPH
jgi:hypothetical protein